MKTLPNTSYGYENINVSVVDFHKRIAQHIWDVYKMTWRDLQDVNYNENDARVQKAVDDVIKMRALPVPREQCIITFRIENISRVCLAQLTRQRKAAFNVESQMPQAVNHNVIVPYNIATSEKYAARANAIAEASRKLYDDLIEDGIPYQDARYLLLHGQTTSLVYMVDINTFIHSFTMRCENNLSDEINLVYRLCLKALHEALNLNAQYSTIDTLTYKFYKEVLKNCDCLGAKQKKGMNRDAVFGNSFKRYPDADSDITDITTNAACDFKKSAWFFELDRMYDNNPELLFEGEKEMIEKWRSDNEPDKSI